MLRTLFCKTDEEVTLFIHLEDVNSSVTHFVFLK